MFSHFSHNWFFVTLWTVALQSPLSMRFSKQEYWSGLLFPSPGHLPNPGIEPRSPTLRADSLPSNLPGKQGWCRGKESTCQCRKRKRHKFDAWVRKWQPTPILLPGEFHGQRSWQGYSPGACEGLEVRTHTSQDAVEKANRHSSAR